MWATRFECPSVSKRSLTARPASLDLLASRHQLRLPGFPAETPFGEFIGDGFSVRTHLR